MANRSAHELQALERIYHLESRSLVRYLQEAGKPLIHDDWDREAKARLEVWYTETRAHLTTLVRLLEQAGTTPGPSAWPLGVSELNYLAMPYAVRALAPRMEALFAAIAAEVESLRNWPEAAAAVKELLERERALLKDLQSFYLNRPKLAVPAAERRHTSANFW